MAELLQQLRENPDDPRLWGAFYARYYSFVYYTAQKLIGDSDSAKDLTQDTFLRFFTYKAYQRITDESACAYLRQTTRRLVFDRMREDARQAAQHHMLQHEQMTWSARFDDEDREHLVQDAQKLANYLSKDDHELLAGLLEGHTLKDMAAFLNVSCETAAVRMHRLKRRIENQLGSKDERMLRAVRDLRTKSST